MIAASVTLFLLSVGTFLSAIAFIGAIYLIVQSLRDPTASPSLTIIRCLLGTFAFLLMTLYTIIVAAKVFP